MNSIDASALNGRPRPRARILQWGEGNFLRAFVDWKIDRMNEAGGLDWGVVIVRPIAEGNPHWLNEQDGLYTVLSRGVADDGSERGFDDPERPVDVQPGGWKGFLSRLVS